jgi:hypothetical protein
VKFRFDAAPGYAAVDRTFKGDPADVAARRFVDGQSG